MVFNEINITTALITFFALCAAAYLANKNEFAITWLQSVTVLIVFAAIGAGLADDEQIYPHLLGFVLGVSAFGWVLIMVLVFYDNKEARAIARKERQRKIKAAKLEVGGSTRS